MIHNHACCSHISCNHYGLRLRCHSDNKMHYIRCQYFPKGLDSQEDKSARTSRPNITTGQTGLPDTLILTDEERKIVYDTEEGYFSWSSRLASPEPRTLDDFSGGNTE